MVSLSARRLTASARWRRFQYPIDARPADAERLWAMIETIVYIAAFGGYW
jgi:hypothetical protein